MPVAMTLCPKPQWSHAGKGAYGTVYKALDKATNSLVAIKVIPLTEQDNEDFATIQKEIAFLSDCNHPNIVKYLVGEGAVRACRCSCARDDPRPHLKSLGPFGYGAPCRHAGAGAGRIVHAVLHLQGSYRHATELWIVMEYCGGGSVSDLIQVSARRACRAVARPPMNPRAAAAAARAIGTTTHPSHTHTRMPGWAECQTA